MKKLLTITIMALSLFIFAGSAFAASAVSEIATTKGGKQVAECAQMMERGISSLATGEHICEH